MKKTKLRIAVDRAAKAATKAYEALADMQTVLPKEHRSDRHQRWISELSEYADYLSSVTWPDQVSP